MDWIQLQFPLSFHSIGKFIAILFTDIWADAYDWQKGKWKSEAVENFADFLRFTSQCNDGIITD